MQMVNSSSHSLISFQLSDVMSALTAFHFGFHAFTALVVITHYTVK
jgi:hypothetical protein